MSNYTATCNLAAEDVRSPDLLSTIVRTLMFTLIKLNLKLIIPVCTIVLHTAAFAEYVPRVIVSEKGNELGRAGLWMFTSSPRLQSNVRENRLFSHIKPDQTDTETITVSVRCNTNENIEVSMDSTNDSSLYSTDQYEFTNTTTQDQIEGTFAKISDRRFVVKPNSVELTQLLHGSSNVQMILAGKSSVELTGTLDMKGFKDAFNYLCVTSKNYADVSALPRKDSIASPCNDPDQWTHCKKPKVYKKSKRSADELRTQVMYMLENYTDDQGRLSRNFLSAIILGPVDEYINGQVKSQLMSSLRKRQISRAVGLMQKYNLRLQTLDEDVPYMGVIFGEEPGAASLLLKKFESARVRRAVEGNEVATVRKIMKGGNYPFNELGYYGEFDEALLLYQSIENGYSELVQLLLDAGASPVARPIDTSGDKSKLSPLSLAIRKKNVTVVKALIQAGAKVASNERGLRETPHAFEAIIHGNVEILEAIFDRTGGANLQSSYQWDLLMEAIWAGKKSMIDFLIPRSDLLHYAATEIENTKILSGETLSYFPAANALFLAQQRNDGYKAELIAALEAQVAKVHGATGVKKMRDRAKRSELALSLSKVSRNVLPDANLINRLSEIIDVFNVLEFTADSDSASIETAMATLLDKHQALIVTGKNLSQGDRDQVQHITDLGGWNQPLHDMLDILFLAFDESNSKTSLDEQIKQWKLQNTVIRANDLQELKLSNWILKLPDSPENLRLQARWQALMRD